MAIVIASLLIICFHRQIASAVTETFRGVLFSARLLLGLVLLLAFVVVAPFYGILREALWGILPSPRSPTAGMSAEQRLQWANRTGPYGET